MSPKLLLITLLIAQVITLTLQQHINVSIGAVSTQQSGTTTAASSSSTTGGGTLGTCTPFNCPTIKHDILPNPKAGLFPSLHIGVLQYSAIYSSNTVTLAKFAAYILNTQYDVNVSVEIYSQISLNQVTMDAATIALFGLANISALIVEADEDGTLSISQLGSAYQAPVISLNSITESFQRKNPNTYPTLFRMTPQMRTGTAAMIQILQDLKKNTSIYIYSPDTYGNSAAADFYSQASAKNISVFSVGVPTSGNINDALAQIISAVRVNWNVFVIAINFQQANRVLRYLNQTGYVGKNYLQILSPNFEKGYTNNGAITPFVDGAIAVLPKVVDPETQAFQDFQYAWAQADQTLFPGAGTTYPNNTNGYLAYDAVFAIVNTISDLMAPENSSYPTIASPTFLTALKNVSFEGVSGDITFDTNGDRVGDYVILNHIASQSVPVGFYSADSNISLSRNFTFFNGTSRIPVLLNVTGNLKYFCSYTPPSSTTSTSSTTGSTPPPENSSSSNDDSNSSSSSIFLPPVGGPTPNITGHIDPNNSSRCICDKGYGGDRCNILVKYKDSMPAISIALSAITLIGFLLALFAVVMLGLYWENFKKHGSFYCAVIIVGVFFSYVSVSMLLPVQTDALCMLFPWFLGIGFTLVYGCLFIKTWTLYQVYRSAEQLKKTSLTPLSVIKGIGAYLAIEILILIIWTAVDRPVASYHKMDDGTYLLTCTAKHATFWGIFAGTKSLWLVFGVVLSFLTRNVTEEYSESKSIAYATYNIMALLAIGIPLALALRNVPGGLVIIEASVILIAFTFTMCSLFMGIWIRIFSNEKITLPTLHSGSRRGSSQTKSSGSQKSSGSRESPRSNSRSGTEPSGSSVEMVVRI